MDGNRRKLLLTIEELADMLGLSRGTVYPIVMGGRIRSVKIGRSRRVPVEAAEAYIQELLEEQGAE